MRAQQAWLVGLVLRETRLPQNWGGDRFRSSVTRKPGDPLSEVNMKKFDPKEVAQTGLPALPRAITSFGAARLEGSIYIYGGHHGEAHRYSRMDPSGELWRLDLNKASEWHVAATGPRLQGLALVAHGGKLYRLGGFSARNKEDEEQDLCSVSDFTEFDPENGEWKELPPMPTPRSSFDAVVLEDRLYVVGGWALQGGDEPVWQDAAHAVDLSRTPLEWKPISKPPFRRRALSVGTFNGNVYVIGGMQPDGKVSTETAVFHPQADTWTEGPRLPGEDMAGFGTACLSLGDRLYVSTPSGNVLCLSNDGKSWERVETLQAGRFFHRMLSIDGQHLVILGGASMKSGGFSEVEVVKIDA